MKAPETGKLERLVQTVSARVGRYLERQWLCRYITRPEIVDVRLSLNPKGWCVARPRHCGMTAPASGVRAVGVHSTPDRLPIIASFFGVLVLGVATALPELTTALVSIAKGEKDISAGLLIGSNVTNPLLGIGLGAMISTYTLPDGGGLLTGPTTGREPPVSPVAWPARR